eukprot:CAMPEP_0197242054 /NCGR_PEP_ID=MMETSP1429-20130617/7912_1 /TAXON_ID=49237 /ORGANISM="Chaetoceros  sp., Strain UNC1202" /LENGTH=76 /DNA_ID=CAMNT_0042701997 /DNA_START=159 /DNA_END=389 /DNA_ORIENTATION=+
MRCALSNEMDGNDEGLGDEEGLMDGCWDKLGPADANRLGPEVGLEVFFLRVLWRVRTRDSSAEDAMPLYLGVWFLF